PALGAPKHPPRQLGLPTALDLILAGKLLRPVPAKKKGLVDRVAPSSKLLAVARQELDKLLAMKRKAPHRRLRGAAFLFSRTPLRNLAMQKARKALEQGQAKFYPAPKHALELCLQAFTLPEQQGFDAEAKALGALIASPESKALTSLFFLTERSKKLGKQPGAVELGHALVVGGGVMGAGIAGLLAQKGVRVRLCDVNQDALAKAKARLQDDLDKRLVRRPLERHEAQAGQDRPAGAGGTGKRAGRGLW